jgi:hypothetical protein
MLDRFWRLRRHFVATKRQQAYIPPIGEFEGEGGTFVEMTRRACAGNGAGVAARCTSHSTKELECVMVLIVRAERIVTTLVVALIGHRRSAFESLSIHTGYIARSLGDVRHVTPPI